MRIKQLDISDLDDLKRVSIETFSDTFGPLNTAENMEIFLKSNYNERTLAAQLNNQNSFFYFVYNDTEEVMGYLKLNIQNAQSEETFENALEIERIYVRSTFQKHGLGRYLFNFAVTKATSLHKDRIWLGVWESNENALAFYQHLGFQVVGSHDFRLGDDLQTDLIMVTTIK